MVEATIDLAALEEHQFIIKPDFDDNLKTYRQRMDELRDAMATEHIRVGNDLKQDTEKKLKLEQHHVYGWCFRLTRNVLYPKIVFLIVGSGLYSRKEGIQCKCTSVANLTSGTIYTESRGLFHDHCAA